MNQINQSPCSDELESVASSSGPENIPTKKQTIKVEIEDKENIQVEQSEEVCRIIFVIHLTREFNVMFQGKCMTKMSNRKRFVGSFSSYIYLETLH